MTKLGKLLLLLLHFVNYCCMLETHPNSKCRATLVEKPAVKSHLLHADTLLPTSNNKLYVNSKKHSHVAFAPRTFPVDKYADHFP
jgi:hypothetical protein